MIETFRGAVKNFLHLAYGLNQLRDTQKRLGNIWEARISLLLLMGLILENVAYICGQVGFLILKLRIIQT